MRNILFSGNVKVFDGILTGMLSIFMRTKSTEPYRIYIFTMDVSHLREDFLPVSDEQIAFLNEVAKSYNKENIVIKIDVVGNIFSHFSAVARQHYRFLYSQFFQLSDGMGASSPITKKIL